MIKLRIQSKKKIGNWNSKALSLSFLIQSKYCLINYLYNSLEKMIKQLIDLNLLRNGKKNFKEKALFKHRINLEFHIESTLKIFGNCILKA